MSIRHFADRDIELAHDILPILVHRVMAYQEDAVHQQNLDPARYCIQYGQLATEVSANPQKLGDPLGYIRHEFLTVLGEQWNEDIPHIQGIVVRKDTGLPGYRFYLFLDRALNQREKEEIFREELQRVFSYPRWLDVLEALGLPRAT